jgi:ribosomal protein L16 Arg81 hydroxylase
MEQHDIGEDISSAIEIFAGIHHDMITATNDFETDAIDIIKQLCSELRSSVASFSTDFNKSVVKLKNEQKCILSKMETLHQLQSLFGTFKRNSVLLEEVASDEDSNSDIVGRNLMSGDIETGSSQINQDIQSDNSGEPVSKVSRVSFFGGRS